MTVAPTTFRVVRASSKNICCVSQVIACPRWQMRDGRKVNTRPDLYLDTQFNTSPQVLSMKALEQYLHNGVAGVYNVVFSRMTWNLI